MLHIIPCENGEVWIHYKKVPNRFMVSNMGRVWSTTKYQLVKSQKGKGGYRRMVIVVGSRTDKSRHRINLKLHQMVAETFLSRPLGKEWTVNHKDMNKTNNKLENLEWLTISDNLKDRWKKWRSKSAPKSLGYDI